MLKGVQKSVMLIKFPKGKYFEEAYFVVRRNEKDTRDRGEMVKEANRIIGDMQTSSRKQGKAGKNSSVFWTGMLVGSLSVALVWLLTLLML
ncbi:MAG: hypothetical protein E7607_07550 [Ruminococcaceae bacterium]|nr:hypothetical protein [Oscillospiraceae bacterium]